MGKNIEEIKAKLQKLFAMMEENNGACEQEVETAMKVARKLMAEYKLSRNDVMDEKVEILRVKVEEVTFSTQVNPWVNSLLHTIADNYCCHPMIYAYAGAKTKIAGLVGYESDIEIAKFVLKYAYDSILSGYKSYAKKAENVARREAYYNGNTYKPLTSAEKTSARNAFGNGYVRGIQEAFAEQNRRESEESSSNSFALVMSTPQEVIDSVNDLKKSKMNMSNAYNKARHFDNYAASGYMCGKEFNPNQRLAG